MDLKNRIISKLENRKKEGTYRSLFFDQMGVDFWSNDYLSYTQFSINKNEGKIGSTGSRLISGNSNYTENVEKEISHFFKGESALLFNSGYDANLGLLSSLPQKNDIIFYDEHIHASMRDGIRLSNAKNYGFTHNSLIDLEKKLQLNTGNDGVKFVCIESLYSMGGDLAPLLAIIQLCEKHDAYLIVDEAHSGGIYGQHGEGISATLGFENRIFARVFTFGKAFGCHGAAVVGANDLKNYLINFSRSFIYTTALPQSSIQHISASLQRNEFVDLRKKLFENICLFRELCFKHNISSISEVNSPIQMIQIGNTQETIEKADFLRKNGFLIKAIVAPTVKQGDEAIRVCIHAHNTDKEIENLISLLK